MHEYSKAKRTFHHFSIIKVHGKSVKQRTKDNGTHTNKVDRARAILMELAKGN